MTKKKFYKRGWTHSRTRGKEQTVACSFCGRRVPKYKTFKVTKGFKISDSTVREEIGARRALSLLHNKMYACPACARHRNIVRKKR